MADFTPELQRANLQVYTGQGAFRFWCQMALPIVYDDSLSYYELLNKVVAYLNNTISDVATAEANIENINHTVEHNMDALLTAYNLLQGYVNDYFNNLDVQEEINNKLDEMASSGALSNLLAPLIPDLVTNWLTAHVNPVGSAVVVDSSLTVAGAAADAKKTGQGITANKNNTIALGNGQTLLTGDFINGAISESNGEILSGYKYRIVSTEYFQFDRDIFLLCESGFTARVAFYNQSNQFEKITGATAINFLGIPAQQKFRISIRRAAENTAETADIETFRQKCFYASSAESRSSKVSSEFAGFMQYTNSINPRIDRFENDLLIDSQGKPAAFNGYFSSRDFIAMPDYADTVKVIYLGPQAYLSEYSAPNENSFVGRQTLANGLITTTARYFRVSYAGTIASNYSQIYFVPIFNGKKDFHSFVAGVGAGTDKEIGKRCNVFAPGGLKYHDEIILTSDDVKPGDTIYYKFSTPYVGYLEVLNTSNQRIRNIGKTSTTITETTFEGSYIIPDTFSKIAVRRNLILEYLNGDTAEAKAKEFDYSNNTNQGFINGTISSVDGGILLLGYGKRVVKRDINYTTTPLYVLCNDADYRFIVATYDNADNLLTYSKPLQRTIIEANTRYRISIRLANEDGAGEANITTFANKLVVDDNILCDYPLTRMPSYIVGALSYRPLGTLTKPYICFSTDDGEKRLATYTLPMFISKNVPLTMCLWSTSQVMKNSVGRAQILSAITDPTTTRGVTITVDPNTQEETWTQGDVINANYNNVIKPNIAQHGQFPWADGVQMNSRYDEKQLYDFFNSEKQAFEAYGMTVSRAAACPYGYTDERMIAETGGYFGVNRAVYTPNDNNIVFYPFYSSGERSNIFSLRAINVKGYSTPTWKDAVDYIVSANKLLCVYLHDWDLDTTGRDDGITDDGDGTSHSARQRLEDLIDYAKAQGVTFINLSDIPNLSAAQGYI